MDYRTIDIENDKQLLIKFRKDTHIIGSEAAEDFDVVSYVQRMKARINKFADGQLIIEDRNKPIGQVGFDIQAYNGEKIGYVNLIYLIPEYRNKGLGRELFQYIEEFFRKFNVNEYHLRVSSRNEGAIRLYTKIGMTIINEENGTLKMKKLLQN